MPINGRRPFQEIVEVCQNELIREGASGEEPKYKGIINQIYSNDLPAILPEMFIKKEGFLTLVADYTVGTVTVGTGTANIIGVGTTWTTAHNDALVEVEGADVIYRVTQGAATSLTFNNSLTWVGSSGTGLTYLLYKDRYQLPSDFSHMLADDPEGSHVVYRWVAGEKVFLESRSEEEYEQEHTSAVGVPWAYNIKWLKELPYMYITLAADSVEIIGYSYIPQLTTLSEYTVGTVTFATSTAVTADSGTTSWLVNITTGTNTYYIRNDADGSGSSSKWIQILSVTGASALTLASAWGHTTGATQTYTISEISKWPSRFDDALLYRAALIVDPDNVNTEKWNSLYVDAVGMDRGQETRRNQTSQMKSWPGLRKNNRSWR